MACIWCQRDHACERREPQSASQDGESQGSGETPSGLGRTTSLWLCGHPGCQHDDVFLGRSLLWASPGCLVYVLLLVPRVLLAVWRWVLASKGFCYFLIGWWERAFAFIFLFHPPPQF